MARPYRVFALLLVLMPLLIGIVFLRVWNSASHSPLPEAPSVQARGGMHLKVSSHQDGTVGQNGRYFTRDGNTFYVAGAYSQWTLQQPPGQPPFQWQEYLAYLQRKNLRLVRIAVRHSKVTPMPWERDPTQCCARDGDKKFNFDHVNPAFLGKLRQQVSDLDRAGIIAIVMLFQGWSMYQQYNWPENPWNAGNNVNGISPDLNHDGRGSELLSLPLPPGVRERERTYIRAVVDAVADHGNVIFEVCNEAPPGSVSWQQWVRDEIRIRDHELGHQHLVGFTVEWPGGSNRPLFTSDADWISPKGPDYKLDPPPSDGRQIVISDSDHWAPDAMTPAQVWQTFTRGLIPLSIEESSDGSFGLHLTLVHDNLAKTQDYASRMDLSRARPDVHATSTGYALVVPGQQYVVFAPAGRSFSVDLSTAPRDTQFRIEWFKPATLESKTEPAIEGGEPAQQFHSPFGANASVLFLERISGQSPMTEATKSPSN